MSRFDLDPEDPENKPPTNPAGCSPRKSGSRRRPGSNAMAPAKAPAGMPRCAASMVAGPASPPSSAASALAAANLAAKAAATEAKPPPSANARTMVWTSGSCSARLMTNASPSASPSSPANFAAWSGNAAAHRGPPGRARAVHLEVAPRGSGGARERVRAERLAEVQVERLAREALPRHRHADAVEHARGVVIAHDERRRARGARRRRARAGRGVRGVDALRGGGRGRGRGVRDRSEERRARRERDQAPGARAARAARGRAHVRVARRNARCPPPGGGTVERKGDDEGSIEAVVKRTETSLESTFTIARVRAKPDERALRARQFQEGSRSALKLSRRRRRVALARDNAWLSSRLAFVAHSPPRTVVSRSPPLLSPARLPPRAMSCAPALALAAAPLRVRRGRAVRRARGSVSVVRAVATPSKEEAAETSSSSSSSTSSEVASSPPRPPPAPPPPTRPPTRTWPR